MVEIDMKKMISVIVPVYNVEKYLEKCVQSIIAQTYQKLQIILVDDGSTDSSGRLCDKFSEMDARIGVIHKENGGLSDARNIGLRYALGEYVTFIDSDDFWENNELLEKITAPLNDNIDLIMYQYKRYDDKSGRMWRSTPGIDEEKINSLKYEEALIYLINHAALEISACTKIVKRDLLIKNNLFFKKGLLSEDIDWSRELFLKAKSLYVYNLSGYIYRKREDSITQKISIINHRSMYYIIEKWAKKLITYEENDKLRDALLSVVSYDYYVFLGQIYSDKVQNEFDLKRIEWLTKYSISRKTKICGMLYHILGRNITGKICAKYLAKRDIRI